MLLHLILGGFAILVAWFAVAMAVGLTVGGAVRLRDRIGTPGLESSKRDLHLTR